MISPFPVSPPQPPILYPLPLPLASMRVLLHPLFHSHLTALASPYTGSINPSQDLKGTATP